MAALDGRAWRRWQLIGLLGCCAIGHAAEPANATFGFQSGVFEGLMLAVDARGSITAYFQEEQGEGVSKRCSFFLTGKATAGKAPVVTWRDEVFPGTLQAEDRAVRLQIERGRDHPGCASVLLPQIAAGISLDRVAEARWTSLRRIVPERSHFHSQPSRGTQKRAFVVSGDVVGVLAERDDWLQVEYRGPRSTTTGWIPVGDTAKLVSP